MSSSCPLLENLVGEGQSSLPRVAAMRAETTPDDTFLLWEGERWTYAQAWNHMLRFASFLHELGISGENQRITSYLPNCPEAMWAWFGTHLSGSIYAPLNRAHKGELLHDMLARTRAKVLITEPSGLAEFEDLRSLGVETVIVTGDEVPAEVTRFNDYLDMEPAKPTFPDPASVCTLMYTSGTTGRSKVVRIPHNMYARGGARVAEAMGYRPDDVCHMWFPLFHIGGSLHFVAAMMIAGGTVAMFPTFSASRFWQQVTDTRATVFGGLANVIHILMQVSEQPDDASNTLRIGLAAMLPPEMIRPFENRFGVQLLDTYGMTEVEPITVPDRSRENPVGSSGILNQDFEIMFADENDHPLTAGERGQILVRPRITNGMMLGYEDDDAATLEVFRNLWFHTGDLGHQNEDGFIFVHGRVKHMIRRRGENISAWELEKFIGDHPDVDEVACVGVPATMGEEDVKAIIVPLASSEIDPRQIHDYCMEKMARFMVPRFIEIRESLPLNQVGKVEKEALKNITDSIWDAERELTEGS
jgi:carnitine-CoA ligase